MFAVKDIESLKNLASILTIPFFSAAYVIDGALDTIQDPMLDWLRNSSSLWLKLGGWVLWLLLVVAVVAIVFLLIDQAIVWLHVKVEEAGFIMPWFGFASLTAGVFVFSYVFPHMPASPLNPFWHLGFLAYGLSLVDRASRP